VLQTLFVKLQTLFVKLQTLFVKPPNRLTGRHSLRERARKGQGQQPPQTRDKKHHSEHRSRCHRNRMRWSCSITVSSIFARCILVRLGATKTNEAIRTHKTPVSDCECGSMDAPGCALVTSPFSTLWMPNSSSNHRVSFRRCNPLSCVVNGVRWATLGTHKFYGAQWDSKTVTLTCPPIGPQPNEETLNALVRESRARAGLDALLDKHLSECYRLVAPHPWS
jgi:hypothetical protein